MRKELLWLIDDRIKMFIELFHEPPGYLVLPLEWKDMVKEEIGPGKIRDLFVIYSPAAQIPLIY